jgi:hypothetical protein
VYYTGPAMPPESDRLIAYAAIAGGLLTALIGLIAAVVGARISQAAALLTAKAVVESQRALARDEFGRSRRERQVRALLAAANQRLGTYQELAAAKDAGEVSDAVKRLGEELLFRELTYTGVADPDVIAAVDKFVEADDTCRGVLSRHVDELRYGSVLSPDAAREFSSAIVPLQKAVMQLNQAADNYVLGKPEPLLD